MKSLRFILPLVLAAFAAAPFATAADDEGAPPPPQRQQRRVAGDFAPGDRMPGMKALSPEERQKFADAVKAVQDNESVVAARKDAQEARKALAEAQKKLADAQKKAHEAVKAAALKADPSLEPIFEKIEDARKKAAEAGRDNPRFRQNAGERGGQAARQRARSARQTPAE